MSHRAAFKGPNRPKRTVRAAFLVPHKTLTSPFEGLYKNFMRNFPSNFPAPLPSDTVPSQPLVNHLTATSKSLCHTLQRIIVPVPNHSNFKQLVKELPRGLSAAVSHTLKRNYPVTHRSNWLQLVKQLRATGSTCVTQHLSGSKAP